MKLTVLHRFLGTLAGAAVIVPHLGGAALLLMMIWKAYLNQGEVSTC